jgi:hypothetical protein
MFEARIWFFRVGVRDEIFWSTAREFAAGACRLVSSMISRMVESPSVQNAFSFSG